MSTLIADTLIATEILTWEALTVSIKYYMNHL